MKKLYSYKAVDGLIQRYMDAGGYSLQTAKGGCGSGDWILFGKGMYTFIIKEVYINEWSSGHTVRKYRKTPAKYQKIIIDFECGRLVMVDGVLQPAA